MRERKFPPRRDANQKAHERSTRSPQMKATAIVPAKL